MNESLVWQSELESRGIVCDPFWNHPDPFEGNFYHAYIAVHPEFSLGVRQTVADMLVAAQEKLPADWQLVLRAGYRPLAVQRALFEAFRQDTAKKHPDWSSAAVLEYARTYVSDPASAISPHCTGGAVDVDVRSKSTDTLIDFGTPINTTSPKSHIDAKDLTPEQTANRKILHDAMLSAGFAPLASEWWHFQYGEQLWAAYYKQESPIYGIL